MTIHNPAPATNDGFGALRAALFDTNGQGALRNIKFLVGGDVTANDLAQSAANFVMNRKNGKAKVSPSFKEKGLCRLTAKELIATL